MDEKMMLDYASAADLTGLKIGTLYSMVSKKQIPHVRITSRLVRFPRQQLESWLRDRLIMPIGAEGQRTESKLSNKIPGPGMFRIPRCEAHPATGKAK